MKQIVGLDAVNQQVDSAASKVKDSIANMDNVKFLASYAISDELVSLWHNKVDCIDVVDVGQRSIGLAKAGNEQYPNSAELAEIGGMLGAAGFKDSAIVRIDQQLSDLVQVAQEAGKLEYGLDQASTHFEALFKD